MKSREADWKKLVTGDVSLGAESCAGHLLLHLTMLPVCHEPPPLHCFTQVTSVRNFLTHTLSKMLELFAGQLGSKTKN